MAATDHNHWHILGAGALGCLWAACWLLEGQSPTLILRDASSARALNASGGIVLTDDTGTRRLQPAAVVATSLSGPIDRLLVTTKAWQTVSALGAIAAHITADASILLLQNGLGNDEAIATLCPKTRLYPGITTDGAWRQRPFTVVRTGVGTTWLGRADGHRDPDSHDRAIVASLPHGHLTIQWSRDLRAQQWAKLAVNCIINPLTALAGCCNGELQALAGFECHLNALAVEVAEVAAADGVDLLPATITAQTLDVLAATTTNRSSMLQDIEAGRPTEIDFINGYVCRRAQAHAIACPENQRLLEKVSHRQPNLRS